MLKGYRELSQNEKDLMNEITAKGAELEALVKRVTDTFKAMYDEAIDYINKTDTEVTCGVLDKNYKFLEVAETHLQLGLMALKRAAAKPDLF